MKIVIDIPENIYYAIMDDKMISREQLAVLEKHVYYGTPLTEDQCKILQRVEVLHAKATALGYIQKPLAWALYQVWKEVDKAESEDNT